VARFFASASRSSRSGRLSIRSWMRSAASVRPAALALSSRACSQAVDPRVDASALIRVVTRSTRARMAGMRFVQTNVACSGVSVIGPWVGPSSSSASAGGGPGEQQRRGDGRRHGDPAESGGAHMRSPLVVPGRRRDETETGRQPFGSDPCCVRVG
jgi:hypothetical protein